MMQVRVNGADRQVDDGATVADLVEDLGVHARGSAVALAGQVVPRTRWPEITLTDGCVVEVLTAVQGG